MRLFAVGFMITGLFLTVFSSAWAMPLTNPYYYEIRSVSGAISHILGTLHIGYDLADLPQQVVADLDQSHVVFTEKKMSREDIQERLANHQAYLKHQLEMRNLVKNSTRSPLNEEELEKLNQMGVPSSIARLLRCDDVGHAGAFESYYIVLAPFAFPLLHSLDWEIMNRASHKRFFELDVAGVREAAFKLKPQVEPEICSLKAYLDRMDVGQTKANAQAELLQYANHDKNENFDPQDPSIEYRNRVWVQNENLAQALEAGGAFIAVGTNHLMGPTGVLELLKARGFQIQRWQGH